MKVSYNILNTFFDGKLPSPLEIENAFTFHSWEIEEVIEKDGDTLFDIKVLPDKSAWALSHRGIAKDLSVVLNISLAHDPFSHRKELAPIANELSVSVQTPKCDRYTAAYITDVSVGPSPLWLQKNLATLGQRSINNVVDATNYVMILLGQPLHAFDAGKLTGVSVGVRAARADETIMTLTGESYVLSPEDTIIVDGASDTPIGIAGVKGGKHAEVDMNTTDLVIESAHFDAISVRKTSQRLKLRTDASMRYENGICSDVTTYALHEVVRLIQEVARGSLIGYVDTGKDAPTRTSVSVSLSKINSVLGLSLAQDTVEEIIARFGYTHSWAGDTLTVTPPFERPDLVIPEDLIEEIGRIHGYDHVVSVTPPPAALPTINKSFYYVDALRNALQNAGFSEVFTSSFKELDEVKLKNALASDKGYLRSTLSKNITEALVKNAPNADLLGVGEIAIFEIGTIFKKEGEMLSLALGVSSPSGYKAKKDDVVLERGISAVEEVLGVALSWTKEVGVAEVVLSDILATFPQSTVDGAFEKMPDVAYKPFSNYPYASRDIAFWAEADTDAEEVKKNIVSSAGSLLVRADMFDAFLKEGKISYAFRLIFQSHERTLTTEEINVAMDSVSGALRGLGYEIR
jgi:phenylalanyl-tRNA synthetase beta chain